MTFATGIYANSICERCSFQYKYSEIKLEPGTRLLVCPECNDGVWNRVTHPLNFPPKKQSDNIALKNPSPDTNLIEFEFIYGEEEHGFIVDYASIFILESPA